MSQFPLNFSVISCVCRERLRRVVYWKRSEIDSYVSHKNWYACKYLWLHPHDLWRHRSPTHTFHLTALLSFFSVSSVSFFPRPQRQTQHSVHLICPLWQVTANPVKQGLLPQSCTSSFVVSICQSFSASDHRNQSGSNHYNFHKCLRSFPHSILFAWLQQKKKMQLATYKHWLSHQSDMFIASYLLEVSTCYH